MQTINMQKNLLQINGLKSNCMISIKHFTAMCFILEKKSELLSLRLFAFLPDFSTLFFNE